MEAMGPKQLSYLAPQRGFSVSFKELNPVFESLRYFSESACLLCLKDLVYCPNQICEGTINSLIPQRDTIKTQRGSGLTSLAFKEHRETLVVHFSPQRT